MPPTFSPMTSHSPVWSPARTSMPSGRTPVAMASAQRTARAGPSGRQHSEDLTLFDRLRDVRIEDFHFGVLDTRSGSKWVNAATVRGVTVFPSATGAYVEEKNPGGEIVGGAALVNVPTLYIEHRGKQLDAKEACHKFIDLVSSLISSTSLTQEDVGSVP